MIIYLNIDLYGKFRCCNDTFTNVLIAANKVYLTKRQIIFRCVTSAFLQYIV